MGYQVYICKCSYPDKTDNYYIGHTNDFNRRMKEHYRELEFGRKGWFRQSKMVMFRATVITECADRSAAMNLEEKFKSVPKDQKEMMFRASMNKPISFLRSKNREN